MHLAKVEIQKMERYIRKAARIKYYSERHNRCQEMRNDERIYIFCCCLSSTVKG